MRKDDDVKAKKKTVEEKALLTHQYTFGGYFFCLTKGLYTFRLSLSRSVLTFFFSFRHVGPERARCAEVGMRIYRGIDGRMLFTYTQLSPGEKERNERVGRRGGKPREANGPLGGGKGV